MDNGNLSDIIGGMNDPPRIRNKGRITVKLSELEDSPDNFRTHPIDQENALASVIEDLGLYGHPDVYLTPTGYRLIDGHLRKALLIKKYGEDYEIEVNVTDFDEAEAKKAMLTHDPLSAMATVNEKKLTALLDEVKIKGPLGKLLDELAGGDDKEPKPITIDLKPQFAVMVKVPDEQTQKQLMEQADQAGFENSAVVTGLAPPKKVEQIEPPAAGVIRITRQTKIKRTARVRQVEGMFDLPKQTENQRTWDYNLELPAEWNLGLIVGPSGSGKTTLAREWFGDHIVNGWDWPAEQSIVDGFPDSMTIHEITGLLSSVGFSSPPNWTKPYHVLSNGEKFRVDVARTLAEKPELAVIDEFTSVVDRTVAQIGSSAIAKAVRQTGRRLVAVSCHSDIIEWLCPDWVLDVETGLLTRRSLRRPSIDIDIRRADRTTWKLFAQHHYLNHDISKSAACYVARIGTRPVAFCAVLSAPHPTASRWRASRIVCLPDYQGIGLGNRLLEVIAAGYYATGKEFSIVTSHPAMIATLAKSSKWRCSREYSASVFSKSIAYLDQRVTCGFVFTGEPNEEYARSLGLIKK